MLSSPLRRRSERWLAGLLAVQLVVGLVAAADLRPAPARRATVGSAVNARISPEIRTNAVKALLAARAEAVLHKDKQAFLATVDPTATLFRARQSRLIDALSPVPLASWSYELDPAHAQPHTAALDALRGAWWAPDVTLRYAIAGYDRSPTVQPQALTFVLRAGRWYVAADDDFVGSGDRTGRDLWDGGPVVALHGRACLVLSHQRNRALARSLLSICDGAVPAVTAVWGTGWGQKVVLLVPDSTAELTRIVPNAGDLSQIAAVATAELIGTASSYRPVGDRVIVVPANFLVLSGLGRRIVLTHEVTHVASRLATGPQEPTWLVEGLAEYVAYQREDVPLSKAASELQSDVRAGRLPSALPTDAAFSGSRHDLAQTYEMSWLAVVLLARRYGQAAMLEVYRDTGADPSPGALERALHKDLHTTVAALTAAWRADLLARLS